MHATATAINDAADDQVADRLAAEDSSAIASKAAHSALVQIRRGAREPARDLYHDAHSLLRTLKAHLVA